MCFIVYVCLCVCKLLIWLSFYEFICLVATYIYIYVKSFLLSVQIQLSLPGFADYFDI